MRALVVAMVLGACGDQSTPPSPVDASEPDAVRSSAKELTSFELLMVHNPDLATDATAVIAGTDVVATARFAASRSALNATFTTTGVQVIVEGIEQVSGETLNNFNTPVTYQVFAEDGSNQSYTVTVDAPSFAPKVDLATDAIPGALAIADFNGDTKPDLAITSQNTVSILLDTTATGATTPTFATRVNFPTGINPAAIAIGDFNADGKPDLATPNQAANTVSVLLDTTATGAVAPSFSAKADFATGLGPIAIAVGDLNGDGKPDIVVGNGVTEDSVSVLLNTTAANAATPSFATKVDLPTGPNPFSLALADFNSDDKLDLVVSHLGDFRPITILLNTTVANATTPSFAPKVDVSMNANTHVLATGDLDGDGLPDLIVAEIGSVVVFRNTTTTTLSFEAGVGFSTGNGPVAIAIADLDDDDKLDLAVANFTGATVAALLNRTTATTSFLPKREFSTFSNAIAVAVADLNGDTRPDLVAINNHATGLSILLAQ